MWSIERTLTCSKQTASPEENIPKQVSYPGSNSGGLPRGVVAHVLDFNLEVSEFELKLHYYDHFRINTFGKGMNPLVHVAMGYMVPLVFFYQDGFSIK